MPGRKPRACCSDFCRSGFSRELFDAQHSFADKSAPAGTRKPIGAIASSLLRERSYAAITWLRRYRRIIETRRFYLP
jgi:hypothetical protein